MPSSRSPSPLGTNKAAHRADEIHSSIRQEDPGPSRIGAPDSQSSQTRHATYRPMPDDDHFAAPASWRGKRSSTPRSSTPLQQQTQPPASSSQHTHLNPPAISRTTSQTSSGSSSHRQPPVSSTRHGTYHPLDTAHDDSRPPPAPHSVPPNKHVPQSFSPDAFRSYAPSPSQGLSGSGTPIDSRKIHNASPAYQQQHIRRLLEAFEARDIDEAARSGERSDGSHHDDDDPPSATQSQSDALARQLKESLPRKASLSDAADAISKLDRMQKSLDSQSKLQRKIARSVRRRRQEDEARSSSFAVIGRSNDDHTSDVDDADSNDVEGPDALGTPNEVLLGIKGLPDFPILAAKKSASKAKSVIGSGVDRLPIGSLMRQRAASPTSFADEEAIDDSAYAESNDFDASLGARLRRLSNSRHKPGRSLDAQAASAMLYDSRNPAALAMTSTGGSTSAANATTDSSGRQTDSSTKSRTLSTDLSRATDAAGGPSKLAAGPSTELKAVQEEHPLAEEEDQEGGHEQAPAAEHAKNSNPAPLGPFPRIPSLHVQEPSSASIVAPHSRSSTVSVKPLATRGALSLGVDDPLLTHPNHSSQSILGSEMHDEPEEMEPIVSPQGHLTAPVNGTGLYGPEASASSSSLSDADDSSSNAGVSRRGDAAHQAGDEDEDDDEDEDESQLASLSLQHGEALTNRQLRKQLKKHKALPMDSYSSSRAARAASLGHKATRALHYASNESRNRRAMEKYSRNPAKTTLSRIDTQSPSSALRANGESLVPYGSRGAHTPASMERSLTPALVPTKDSRASTPGKSNSATPSRRSMDSGTEDAHQQEAGSEVPSRIGSPLSPQTDEGAGHQDSSALRSPTQDNSDRLSLNLPRRWGTARSLAPSINESYGASHLHAPRPWHFRQRRKWAKGVAEESLADGTEVSGRAGADEEEDAEKELEKVLHSLVLEQAPEEAGEKFEWDVLYENQRGMLIFGIPKFSSRTLLQWDPSPWTDIQFQNSPYNIVNAQLPDPSWEWVYPEWLIDMSGDVDESGWQYSGNFGSNPFSRLHRFARPLPQPGPDGNLEMNERLQRKQAKKRQQEMNREDDGLEALKRSVTTRNAKWTSQPNPGSFVRRRRWIRLRRRKALSKIGDSGKQGNTARQPKALRIQAGQLSRPSSPAQNRAQRNGETAKPSDAPSDFSSESSASESSSSDFDEEDENTSADGDTASDGESDHASPYSRPSAFLPRRTAGRLANTPDPLQPRSRDARERASRRHQKEFTGTLREIKHLLPAILDPRGVLGSQRGQDLSMAGIDARQPFLSWKFIKKRLADDDMSWKATSLRQRERHYQTRKANRLDMMQKKQAKQERSIPSAFMSRPGGQANGQQQSQRTGSFSHRERAPGKGRNGSIDPGHNSWITDPRMIAGMTDTSELTHDAVVEINWLRVKRVLRACKLDRQKFDLWKLWLGLEVPIRNTGTFTDPQPPGFSRPSSPLQGEARRGSMASIRSPTGTAAHGFSSPSNRVMRHGTHSSRLNGHADPQQFNTTPDPDDVWDVLERRLDSVLYLFEYDLSRARFLQLLISVHDTSHVHHRYARENVPWYLRDHAGSKVEVEAPAELNPLHTHGEGDEMGTGPRADEWVIGLANRLQYFSDIQGLADALKHRDQQAQSPPPPRSFATTPPPPPTSTNLFNNFNAASFGSVAATAAASDPVPPHRLNSASPPSIPAGLHQQQQQQH